VVDEGHSPFCVVGSLFVFTFMFGSEFTFMFGFLFRFMFGPFVDEH